MHTHAGTKWKASQLRGGNSNEETCKWTVGVCGGEAGYDSLLHSNIPEMNRLYIIQKKEDSNGG